MIRQVGILIVLMLCSKSALCGIDTYEFETETDRERYIHFIDELRCPKCKNQNLAGSNAPIAKDLRRELHRLIVEGNTDEGIVDFMVARYGDFVLYRPPLQKNTYVLWYGPIAMLLLGLIVLVTLVYRRSKTPNSNGGLTDAEQESLESFIKDSQTQPANNTNKK